MNERADSTATPALVEHFPELAAVEVQDLVIPGGADVAARLYRAPVPREGPALVWVHGGGFISGDLDMAEANWVGLALAAQGVPVLSLDYRLALDGVHFPGPSDDVLAGWRWAVVHTADLGTVSSLHLGGASAGANLAAGVTKRLRDTGGPLPATVVLGYPIVHRELPPFSQELRAALDRDGAVFSPDLVYRLNVNYVGGDAGLADPYAFAANGDVSGQPPVYVLNSESDELRASGEAYAALLVAAGVEARVEFEPGTRHGHLSLPFEPEARRSIDRIVAWLRDHDARP